jgi:parallel beta-helix repeat protein
MNSKVAAVCMSIAMMVGIVVIVVEVSEPARGAVLYVGGGGPGNYSAIQDAINASQDGDTVFVYNGTYYERIEVNKTINLTGEGRNITIIDGNYTGNVVEIVEDYVNVSGFTIRNSGTGVYPDYYSGIILKNTNYCYLYNNNFTRSFNGIFLISSSYNRIADNIIIKNGKGIQLTSSSNNNTIESNNVSDHPNYGINIELSSNITLKNNIVSENFYGVYFISSLYTYVENNIVHNNTYGITIGKSFYFNISENIVVDNGKGIDLQQVNDSVVAINNLSNNGIGIALSSSVHNDVYCNNISNGSVGIGVYSKPSYNNITDNIISRNRIGVSLSDTSSNNLMGNTMINNGIFIRGILDNWNVHNIDTSNTVNGRPVYYWKNQTSGIIPSDAGEIILANCTNVRIENQVIDNSTVGIELGFSSNIEIHNNNISSCWYGAYLYYSDNNTISSNIMSRNHDYGINLLKSSENDLTYNNLINNDYGIYTFESNNNSIVNNYVSENYYDGISLVYSNGSNIKMNNVTYNNRYGIRLHGSVNESHGYNRVYYNNIINNKVQAYDSTNHGDQWDNGYPSGGNFWSDYNGMDFYNGPNQDQPGNDGIGDTNYTIDSNSIDNYPLMQPIGNCTFLYEGWNLISVPFVQSKTNLGDVLFPILGSFDAVQWYNTSDKVDRWNHNHTLKPSHLNDLTEIDRTMGFWVHILEPIGVLFEYPGTQPTSNQSIPLNKGWNMVGYPSLYSKNRTAALNNLEFGTEVDAVWTHNAAAQKWEEVGEPDSFFLGKGYWIHATMDCVWDVPL